MQPRGRKGSAPGLLCRIAAVAAIGAGTAAAQERPAPFLMTPADLADPALATPGQPFRIDAADVEAAALASGRTLTYQGTESAGFEAITNNEGDLVEFLDESTAANATIVNNTGGAASFEDQSSAGSALMTNNAGATLSYGGNATAATSNTTNNEGGLITFGNMSSAGSAAFANNGSIWFRESASAQQSNIVNNAGASVTFSDATTGGSGEITNNGSVAFEDQASAGSGLITNNGGATLSFRGSSSAASVAVNNNGGMSFADESSAGSANIVSNATGTVRFGDQSGAGDATFANSGRLDFESSSSAETSEIVNNATGIVSLSGQATLGDALLNNGGLAEFSGSSSAGASTIITGPAGRTNFFGDSSGGTAALQADLGGVVDFSGITDGAMEVGSIAGPGTFYIGGVALSVGSNNQSTTVDGDIVDGGQAGGTAGSLIKTGSGMLTLGGDNSYTGATRVVAGVLQAGGENAFAPTSAFTVDSGALLDLAAFDQVIGSLAGAGTVDLATARLTTGGNGGDTTFSGMIGGTGGITKTGTGTMELAGINTYSGATIIAAGELLVSGSIADSAVTVGTAGRLSGDGSVGATSVAGTLARQNQGTLNVVGDLDFEEGATFEVELDAGGGTADLVAVTGTAALAGQLVVMPVGTFTTAGTTYRLLSATDVTGALELAQTDMPFIDLALTPGLGTIDLTVSRNGRSFLSTAETRNQRAVAVTVEGIGSGDIYDAIVASDSEATARSAFDALSGEVHASLPYRLLADQLALRDTILAEGGARDADGTHGARTWSAVRAFATSTESDGNAAAHDWNGGGIVGGVDGEIGAWRVGVAAGYGNADLDLPARASEADVDTLSIAGYGRWSDGQWRAVVGGLYSWHRIDTSRSVAFTSFRDEASANYDARSASVFGHVGYLVSLSQLDIEPFANLTLVRLETDSWAEAGGDAALRGESAIIDGITSTLGARFSARFPMEGAMLHVGATAGWRYAGFDDDDATFRLADGAPFLIGGVPIDENALVLGADARLAFGAASLGLAYGGVVGSLSDEHWVRANLNVRF